MIARVEAIPALAAHSSQLDEAQIDNLIHELRPTLQALTTRPWVDLGDLERARFQALLHERTTRLGEDVDVIWLSTRAAIRTSAELLVSHIEDLWLPAADDIVVLSLDHAHGFILDHEERLYDVAVDMTSHLA